MGMDSTDERRCYRSEKRVEGLRKWESEWTREMQHDETDMSKCCLKWTS